MKRFFVLFVMLGAAMLLFETQAFAKPPGGGMAGVRGFGGGGGQHMERMMEELGLSEDQQQKLEANREAQIVIGKKLFKGFAEKQKELAEELEKESTNRSAINALAAHLKDIQGQMIDHRIDSVLAVKEILTPEQFQKFSKGVKSMRDERRGMKKKDRKEKRKKKWKKDKDGEEGDNDDSDTGDEEN